MTNPRFTARTLLLGLGAGIALGLVPAPPAALAPAPLAAQSASQLDAVVEALRTISTMRADFTQTDRQGNVMAGVMTLKRPGKIRFD